VEVYLFEFYENENVSLPTPKDVKFNSQPKEDKKTQKN
jgi:hypothetical protein